MSRVPVIVPITDDKVLEGDEDFTLTINRSMDYKVDDNKHETRVIIKNDDCKYLSPYIKVLSLVLTQLIIAGH